MKFIIVGSGRRVQQDVLPVLSVLGVKKVNISIYAKREREILVRDVIYDVLNFKKLVLIQNECIVYLAVPHIVTEKIIARILDINQSVKIIIDTPINNISIVKKYNKFNICVSEDAAFLGKYLLKNNLDIKKYNFLFLFKSAISYHAIAFIESLLSEILFHFSFFGIYVAVCKKGIAIILGKRNYEKGFICLNHSKIKFPKLSIEKQQLIGGLSNYDSVSYRFLELKRIGLFDLINNFINNSKESIPLSDGYSHFKKSKMINNYSIKRLLKIFAKTIINYPKILLTKKSS